MAVLIVSFYSGSTPNRVRFDICTNILLELMGEVHSPLNRYATQVRFSVHEPTLMQFILNYTDSGGFQRFLDRHPVDGYLLTC